MMRIAARRIAVAVALVGFALPSATVKAQERSAVDAPARVRGAHENIKNPEKTFTDDLDLTVPGTPIDHPARVYPATEDFRTGPALGERLPDFTLPNQRAERIDFHKNRAGRKAVVVFIRSAVW